MAKPVRILSLNLGMQTVGLADFRSTPEGGLVLHSFSTRQLVADPGAESSRVAQIKLVIREMLGDLKLKGGRVNYSIAAQSVFTRFVKLPTVDPEKIDQIVQFEAQQNVPFPIEEVVWDYQLVASKDENKIEVVLVAIKADLLDDLNSAVEEAGLSTGIVDVAPMALYNAFRYNYADTDGCSLLVDIGARTTNLIFVEPNKVFSRSIPIGGTTFTTNIAREFNEAFGAAEERKCTVGFVSLGGSYAEPTDPEIARVSKIIRNSMTRLHAEITRSISFYRSQQGGSQPQRIFLCGGSVGLPYIREFFSEKLQMPIEFFNPLRNVRVAAGVDAEAVGRQAHAFGELVGLAIRSACEAPMELNLEPASVTKNKLISSKRPFMIMAGLCLLLSIAGCWLYFLRATQVEGEVIDKIVPQVKSLQVLAADFDKARNDIQAAKASADPFVGAVQERDYWVRLINDFNSRLPQQYIWITGFGFPQTGGPGGGGAHGGIKSGASNTLRLHGLFLQASNTGLVNEFNDNLNKSPFVAKAEVIQRATTDASYWDFDYEIQVELKPGMAPQ